MAIDFKKLPKINTPRGVAVYPRLNAPDTKFKPAGEFMTKLRLTNAEAAPLIEKIEAFAKTAYADECQQKGVKSIKKAELPFRPSTEKVDGETKEIPGYTDFVCKRTASGKTKAGKTWNSTIPLYDAKGKPMNDEVWGGSEIKCRLVLLPWVSPLGFGIKLQIDAVQVLSLVSRGERNAAAYGFEEEEGFEATTPTTPSVDETAKGEGEANGSEGLDEF